MADDDTVDEVFYGWSTKVCIVLFSIRTMLDVLGIVKSDKPRVLFELQFCLVTTTTLVASVTV